MISTENKIRSNSAREGQVDVREDEDQGVKLSEIIELLVAAGYFRARIKGLSPFDKIVGGMTWCIETCNFDVDVDLLFHENLTIGQKIALTEKIVRVVRSMKCPHRLEPHQIQGLDAIHVFPVIQWLVKKALETREEFGDETRNFSVLQFCHYYTTPQEEKLKESLAQATHTLSAVHSAYGPKRRWRRKDSTPIELSSMRVQTTLLEYGHLSKQDGQDQTDTANSEMAEVEELMAGMDVAEVVEGKLSAHQVGNIVSARVQEIAATSKHYSELQQQITEEIVGDSATSQARMLASLEKQRSCLLNQLAGLQTKQATETAKVEKMRSKLQEVKQERRELEIKVSELGGVDTSENKQLLEQLSQLVEENEKSRKRETEFKDSCRKESEKMKKEISNLQTQLKEVDVGDEVTERCKGEKEKYTKMRRQLAKKTRQVEALKRYIDDVPGRAELTQYQRRFIELYNQVAATHRETQQFYNMYNTLADTRMYMDKELSLLNSILDNMAMALGNTANMDEYLQQLDTIVEGIRQNKLKLERRRVEERVHRNALSDELGRLQELNRQYAKTVHLLGQEINRNEMLHQKVTARGSK
ncbi:Coiled-coil domain-containing protein 93-like [Homarus americanus]|uniref:Coiled-coil domain-containing protein 93 n=2 Tax=Homarus americanus TaxID=6706 RepID=A0A8J5MTW3_HOMAM|nr:Coiled-coil domain-containing protein 93-like [Homarus americanus]